MEIAGSLPGVLAWDTDWVGCVTLLAAV